MTTEFIAVPAIAFICWYTGYCVKEIIGKPKVDRFIPVICGVLGGILGGLAYGFKLDMIAANDWITAIATGIFSGLGATGANQVYKQLTKKEA